MSASRKSKKIRAAKTSSPRASNSNEAEVREIKKIFSRHIPEDDRRRLPEQDLQALAGSFWAFAQTRAPGKVKLRIFNPTLKKDGYVSRHTVILLANDDMPFLVDSITGELSRMGLAIHLILHPIISIARDAQGQCQKFSQKREPERLSESWMYLEIDETPESAKLKEITHNLENTLRQVRLAVTDWQAMRRKTLETLSELPRNDVAGLPPGEREEAANFLAWLEFDHFTFLGTRDYHVIGSGKKRRLERQNQFSLGILRDPISVMFRTDAVEGNQPSTMHQFLERKQLVLVTKTHCPSMVHRNSPMDAILIKRFEKKGRLIGERLFVGLFTSSTYSEMAKEIPLVRSKIAYVLDKAGFDPRSHDGKMLAHLLNVYPRDELFQISAEELYATAMAIVDLQQRQHLALFTRDDPFGRFVSCLIFTPRDQYHTKLRQKFQEILCQAFNGISTDFNVKITDDPLAQIFVVVRTRDGHIPPYDKAALERLLQETGRDWGKKLQDNLVTAFGENQGLKLSRRYAAAFPDAYRDSISPEQAMSDIAFAEDVLKSGQIEVNLYRPDNTAPGEIRLKWFSKDSPLLLSRILSVMRHMGLEADAVMGPYQIHPTESKASVWIQDCHARLPQVAVADFDLTRVKPKFEEGLLRAWSGEIESDPSNQLILLANLSWREVVILRALSKYLRQAGVSYSETLRIATFAAHPRAAWLMVELFKTRHDPALKEKTRAKKTKELENEFKEYLNGVQRAEHDIILSRYMNVVQNILRTNYFQKNKEGFKPYLSFKLDSRKLDDLPLPRPMVEIFVYSPRMEGFICAAARWRVAAFAGRTGARISAPKSSA
ncbi:MAG: NAD-glutamate dehydrogenase [Proteobacteria bacterium]|nr:NAD-glutamate dehydrogenase [Pseudomonadota bacterium]